MALVLLMETSTVVCSVALAENGKTFGCTEIRKPHSHSRKLTMMIRDLLEEKDLSLKEIDAVAVSMGPGSYTGLRIGISTAKGLCYGLDRPLIAVNTIKAMAAGFIREHEIEDHAFLCPMLDARRAEVYCAVLNTSLCFVMETSAYIVNDIFLHSLPPERRIYFFGEGVLKCKKILEKYRRASLDFDFYNSASHMASLAEEAFKCRNFVSASGFEPFYLKDFVGRDV